MATALNEIAALAASLAADDLGYPSVAALILEKQLSPAAIARLFAMGAARDCGRSCALILLAGSTARRDACPEGWDGSLERELAWQALRPRAISLWQGGRPIRAADAVAWNKIAMEAVAIVSAHWGEVAGEA